ncbi:hypothetical protein CRUP_027668 [Coryphaenoides rupestris]|nr:hypothetical protein CRUP_027668 [Coryphaenoides rupestris]
MIATTQQNITTELDLGSSGGPPRNWKGICIALVVIVGVMSMVIMSVILLSPDESRLLLRSRLSMEDLEKDGFKVHDPCVAWLSEHEVALRSREGHVLSYNLQSNLTSALVDNSSLDLTTTKFYVSADKAFVLLADLLDLSPPDGGEQSQLQYAGWGPQGNQLIYVHGGDIFYQPSVSSPSLRLTTSGQESQVVNGLSDWTYEEEVLLSYAAHWWSVDGARLAYLTVNNTATPLMEIPLFLGDVYPSNRLFPYPKAGSNIPSVSLFVVNLYGPTHTLEMMPPDSFRSRDGYVSMVTWISSTRLAVRWLNRSQNQSVLCVCEATTGACSEKHKMVVDLMQNRRQDIPLFSADGSVFYVVLPAKQGARGEFYHIASVSSQEAGRIYFLSTEGSRQSRHLYSVDLNGVFLRQCLSCDLIDGCSFFRAEFSYNQTNFLLHCLGYIVLEDNAPLAEALGDKQLPESLFRTLSTESHDLHLKLSLPRGYEANLHPLLLIVDGVPGGQSVTEEFSLDWPQVLSSAHGVALAWADGRSGAAGGHRTGSVDPRKLGSLRVKDYLAVVEWLVQQPYIDDRRMALYGKTASLLEEVNKLKDENILILHGTADASVHFQHSAELVSRLVKVEANYSLQMYPDEGHDLRDPRSVQHLQRTLVSFLQGCMRQGLLLAPPEDEPEDEDDN